MTEATTDHHCKDCRYYTRADNIKPVSIGVNFLNKHTNRKSDSLPLKNHARILTIIAGDLEIGYTNCGDTKQTVGSTNICDKENKYNPRMNLKYLGSFFQRATSIFLKLTSKHS